MKQLRAFGIGIDNNSQEMIETTIDNKIIERKGTKYLNNTPAAGTQRRQKKSGFVNPHTPTNTCTAEWLLDGWPEENK
jgi:hypothetical protein